MVALAEVLRRYWPQYERQFGSAILPSQRRAVQAILSCRTPALGGQVYRCAHCQRDHFVYHSCNHRACPQCGQADAAQWVEQQQRKLLPVPYYLITFTVPEALRPWLRSHQRQGYALLLSESAATLQEIASHPKYLGAQLGLLSVLHTWGAPTAVPSARALCRARRRAAPRRLALVSPTFAGLLPPATTAGGPLSHPAQSRITPSP